MKMLSLAAALTLSFAACQADGTTQEKKIDALSKDVAALNSKIDQLIAGGGVGRAGAAGAAGAAQPAKPQPPRRTADPAATYAFKVDGLPSVGPADAKITVVKNYEYMCPFCEKVNPTIEQLKAKYGKDIRFVYSQFVVHPPGATAPSLAACAAAKQGKFEQMDAKLWDMYRANRDFDKTADDPKGTPQPLPPNAPPGSKPRMPQISCHMTPEGCPKVEAAAASIGLDLNKFKADMKACEPEINASRQAASLLGVSATPGFFVNGRFVSGAQKFEVFTAVIDEELAKANQRIAAGTKQADYYNTWVVEKGEKEAPMKSATGQVVPTPAPGAAPTVQVKPAAEAVKPAAPAGGH